MSIRYLGQFYDPSYTAYDMEFLAGFTSLREAGNSLLRRYTAGRDDYSEYRENRNGLYVHWEESYTLFPAVTEEASYELYAAIWLPVTRTWYRSAAPVYRLTIGPRKGVVVKKY